MPGRGARWTSARRATGCTGVDAQQPGRVGAFEPVQDAHPQHRLRLGHVVPEQGDRVGVVDVLVRAGLAVGAEALLEGLGGGRGAQPGVAVEVVGADADVGEDGEGVVLLQEELPAGVEADGAGTALLQQAPGAGGDAVHGGVPVGLDEPAVLPDEGAGEAVRGVVGLPAVEVLGAEPAAVDPVGGAAPHAHDASAAHRDVHGVAVGVQDRGGGHPPLHVVLRHPVRQVQVGAGRPGGAGRVGVRTPHGSVIRSGELSTMVRPPRRRCCSRGGYPCPQRSDHHSTHSPRHSE